MIYTCPHREFASRSKQTWPRVERPSSVRFLEPAFPQGFFAEGMTQSFTTSGQINHVPITTLPACCLKKRDLKNPSALCGDRNPGAAFNGLSHPIGGYGNFNFVLSVKLDPRLRYSTRTSPWKLDLMCVLRTGMGILSGPGSWGPSHMPRPLMMSRALKTKNSPGKDRSPCSECRKSI